MRTIKLLILAIIVIVLAVLGWANVAPVDLKLLPAFLGRDDLAVRNMPLAVVILAAFLFGLIFGLIIEYLRETKHRAEASRQRREVGKLRHEVTQLAREAGKDEDLGLPAR